MTLPGEYNDVLLTEYLIEALQDGEVPTVDELVDQLDQLRAQYPLIGQRPLFSIIENEVGYYENASSSKFNSSFSRLEKDIHVLYDTINKLKKRIVENSQRWSTHYNTKRRYLDELEDRIDALLLMENETLGYFKYISDDFSSVFFVDLDATTAEVDTGLGVVTISHDVVEAEGYSRIDLSGVASQDISISPVSGPGIVSFATIPGYDILDIFSDTTAAWGSWLKTTGQYSPGTVAVQIKLTDSSIITNRITLSLFGSTATSAFVVSIFYSTNGIDWLLVPTEMHTQSILDGGIWTFPELETRYLRILMTKNAPEEIDANGYYVWSFGLYRLCLYHDRYDTTTGYVVQSSTMSVEDGEFTKVALSVCEAIEDKTDISYYISVDLGSSFHAMDPIERESPAKPQILDFSELQRYTNQSSLNRYDNVRTALQLDLNNNAGLVLETTTLPLNFYISSGDIDGLLDNEIVVYRNIVDITSSNNVRGVSRGWHYDETTAAYSCIFVVSDPDGVSIDLGATSAVIDGTTKTGSVFIPSGAHTLSTSSANWRVATAGANTLSELKQYDMLYPQNHKLLIEGYSYGSSYADERVYLGMSLVAEGVSAYISDHIFDSDTDDNDISVYTRAVDSNGNIAFLFKTNRSFSDYINEEFVVSYPLMNKTFTHIIFKAILRTTDSTVSPVLDSYLLKLG